MGGAPCAALRRRDHTLSTLAVLPFKPLATEARDELLEMGMADSLIARLSTVPGLVVRSVGSVRRYAGAEQDPLRAARELDVAWIVDGSLQRRGDQLRVTARLLRSTDGVAAWTGTFDEKFTGVFEVQDAISARVAKVLAPSLEAFAGTHPPLSALGGTRNTDAYQLYRPPLATRKTCVPTACARAWRCTAKRWTSTPAMPWPGPGLPKRIGGRCSALTQDHPTHSSRRTWRSGTPSPWSGPGRSACRAGVQTLLVRLRWSGAEREFRRALAINPNVAAAHFGLAGLLLNQDRLDEGFAQMRLTRELDPMSPVYNTLEAAYLLEAGRRTKHGSG